MQAAFRTMTTQKHHNRAIYQLDYSLDRSRPPDWRLECIGILIYEALGWRNISEVFGQLEHAELTKCFANTLYKKLVVEVTAVIKLIAAGSQAS